MTRLVIVLFAIGATLGSLLDGIHTWSGTTEYTPALFLRAAWWTPIVFGLAAVSTGLAYPLTRTLTKKEIANARTAREIGTAFAAFVLLYFASGFMRASNPAKLAVLAIGAAYLWARFARTREAAMIAVVAAIVGPLVEVVLVSLGTFRHLQPDFVGIPMWLPALYAAGSIAFGLVGLRLSVSLLGSGARSLP